VIMYDMYSSHRYFIMNLCLCAYLYISLCIEVILSLFMSLCFSCILLWITWIEFLMTLNIHQVFGVSLEEQLILLNHWILWFYLIYSFIYLFFSPQIIVFVYFFVHILEKWRYIWKKRIGMWAGCAYINRHCDIGVHEICKNTKKKTQGGDKYRTEHKPYMWGWR